MKYTPTLDQVRQSKSWTELYEKLGVHHRNTRAQQIIKGYVTAHFENDDLPETARKVRLSDGDFAEIVKTSRSVRQAIQRCGWKVAGGSYLMFHDRVKRQGMNIDHFVGQAYAKGTKPTFKSRPLEEHLVNPSYSITSHRLKVLLLKNGLKEHRCEVCLGAEWRGQPTPIALDHINGDRHDNRLQNLRIICPNCHAQTPTFAGRNNKGKRKPPTDLNGTKCSSCGGRKSKRAATCMACRPVPQKIDWETLDLMTELTTKSKSQLGRELGCSDNAINKRIKKMVTTDGLEPIN